MLSSSFEYSTLSKLFTYVSKSPLGMMNSALSGLFAVYLTIPRAVLVCIETSSLLSD